MLPSQGRSSETLHDATATVFQLLGGELSAIDLWTRVDVSWMHEGSVQSREAVGYAGLPMSYRVAGLTLGDADAAPSCPPFLVEIWPERLIAQVVWQRSPTFASNLASVDIASLHHWAAGSLTKNLRVVRFGDGDVGLEADLHVASTTAISALREFVTAFSWDVAALHAFETSETLRTTEEWVRRAALSISRSTPTIPLREHEAPEWRAFESPRGVFCSLQPSGGLCESDNVLYAVRRDASVLQPLVTMPGHRSDWDTTRLTDVWLSRDGSSCFARSLLCEGFVTTSKGEWHAVDTAAVTAVAPWGADGFLLGLHDGRAVVLDGDLRVTPPQRLAKISGRFLRLVTHGTRAFGLVGHTVVSAEVGVPYTDGRRVARGAWSVPMELLLTFDQVGEIDVDAWSQSPAIAVLGDDAIMILDALTGDTRSRYSVTQARQAKWIGAGLLLVLDVIESRSETRTRIRVLDVLAQRWTEPVVTSEVSRIAVRGDEIHVGYANQTIAVWDRRDVCRGIGAWSFRTEVPDGRGSDRSAPVISDVVVEKTTAS